MLLHFLSVEVALTAKLNKLTIIPVVGQVSMDIDSPDFVPSVFVYTAQREDPQSKLDR